MDLPFDLRAAPRQYAEAVQTRTTKPLVAIVDDDGSVGRAISRLVRHLGMEAQAFASGEAFLGHCDATPSFVPDCVVLDVQMPGLSGLDVQTRLAERGAEWPVIIMTAYIDLDAPERALGMGAVAALSKPFEDELFIRTLNAAIERSARRGGAGAPPH